MLGVLGVLRCPSGEKLLFGPPRPNAPDVALAGELSASRGPWERMLEGAGREDVGGVFKPSGLKLPRVGEGKPVAEGRRLDARMFRGRSFVGSEGVPGVPGSVGVEGTEKLLGEFVPKREMLETMR